jgi:TetR/AcrR family transcriptional regulator
MGIKERKEREKEARREEIVGAAEKIFFEKGLAQATMDDIAEAAELSKGTLYLYYKSKEDLYLSVAMKGSEILCQMFLRIIESGEPTIKMIFDLGEAYYEYFKTYRNYFRMYYFFENPQVQSQVSEEMMEVCLENDRRIWDLVESVLQRGIDEGLLRKDLNPLEAGVMLWSNSNGMMRIMDRQEPYWKERMGLNPEKMMRESNRMLVEGMLSEEAKKQDPFLILMDKRVAESKRGKA